jgi:hypothetical protein
LVSISHPVLLWILFNPSPKYICITLETLQACWPSCVVFHLGFCFWPQPLKPELWPLMYFSIIHLPCNLASCVTCNSKSIRVTIMYHHV